MTEIDARFQISNGLSLSITGNTAGATSFLSTGAGIIAGGSNVTLSQAGQHISINAAAPTAAFTLNGTTGSVSLSAGAGVGIGQANSTITLSASVQTASVSLTALGNTTSSSSGTFSNLLNISGAGIVSIGAGAGSITISATTPSVTNFSTVSLTALGNSTVSSTGSFNNLLNISGAGGISIGAGAGSVTISGPTAGVNFSTISLSASGNTTGATSSGTFNNVLAFSGMGIASIGAGNGTVSISVTTPSVTNFSTISLTALGNTTVSSAGTMNNLLNISGAGIASVGVGAGSLTISVPATAFATQSLSAGANSVTGTAVSLALVAGNNISLATATGAGSMTVTISELLNSKISLTQNIPLQQIGGSIASASGTVTGTAGFGSSLFLQRIDLPAAMTLTEVDLAVAASFNATSNGAGTMSQSFVLYSFGNSSSLASVGSASTTYAWQTGTSTSGAVVSLTQFQGGWSVPKIHPMTFATTSIKAGEYVVGNLINFAQASSTWTVQLLGALASITNSTTLSNVTSAAALAITNVEATATFTSANNTTILANGFTGLARTILSATTTQSIVPQYLTVPNLVYIGTNSTTSGLPSVFLAGIMSTGAIPAAITLTSTAVTFSGTPAGAQPYWALVGS